MTCGKPLCFNNIPLLSSLSPEETDQISAGVSSKIFEKGELIFRQGERSNRLYIVCSGQAKVYRISSEGKEQILYLLSGGDFIGAFNLLKEDEFAFSAEALETTHVSMLEKTFFDQIVLSNPQITLKIFEKAYERINKAENLVARLSSGNPGTKVLRLLRDLASDFGTPTPEGILLELNMSREEMANYAGIARETMSRKLQFYQDAGLIKLLGNKKIIIYDITQLRAMIDA